MAILLVKTAAANDCQPNLATLSLQAQRHPKNANVWYELGMCQARSGFRKEAEDSLARAVALNPNSGAAAYQLSLSRAMHSIKPGDWCRSSAVWNVMFNLPETDVRPIKPAH